MKRLASSARYLFVGALLAPMASFAGVWSSCQTITSVTDYTANNGGLYLNLSPGISGCVADTNGGTLFRINAAGVTADSYKNLYASTMLAYALGKQVMIYYDNSALPACLASIISIGGTTNQCN